MYELEESDSKHSSIIIHIDVDHFYSQVEEILNPEIKDKPVGIQQRHHIVTCNYHARKFGITKMMLVHEAKKKCPQLTIVNGEDLSNYKKFSNRIFEVLQKFTDKVEKLGFDENYLDVTNVIERKLEEMANNEYEKLLVEGYIHPNEELLDQCKCGCKEKLVLGTHLAKEIREQIHKEIGLTTCAGIGHNKLLAKLIGSMHKPNKQTLLAPLYAKEFLAELNDVKAITGIGPKTASLIEEIGIKSITELQTCDIEKLRKAFGYDLAVKLKEMSYGRDASVVKTSGKPKSIGLEDSCKSISIRCDVEQKFRLLLTRLVQQISEDDRIPVCIKLTLRKYDPVKKTSHRETKQCNILPSLFKNVNGKIILADNGHEKLMKTIMNLFDRIIPDMKTPFNITLLGLCFSKFQERQKGTVSMSNFLMKKSDVEVQAITNLSNESTSINFDSFRSKTSSPLCDNETMSNNSIASLESGSESEVEPSPKKKKLNILLARRRCNLSSSTDDIASPSKLRVSDLRLNSLDKGETSFFSNIRSRSPSALSLQPVSLTNIPHSSNTPNSGPPIVAPIPIPATSTNALAAPSSSTVINPAPAETSESTASTSSVPTTVDMDVFKDLPPDIQNELLVAWHKPQITSCTVGTSTTISTTAVATAANNAKKAKITNSKNTLHKYFIRNS